MRAAAATLAVLVVLVVLAPPAHAGDVALDQLEARLDVTSTTTANFRVATPVAGDEFTYGEIYERLNLRVSHEAWDLGARVDAHYIGDDEQLDVETGGRYQTEKLWLGWTSRSLEARIGDSYVSFGRGLTLSLRKVDELGVDTTLRGAKAMLHAGPLDATLVAGWANPQNVDEGTGESIEDLWDRIAGAQVLARLPSGLAAGGQVAAVQFRDALTVLPVDEEYTDTYVQGGPTIDAPRLTEHLGFYLEGVAQHRRERQPLGDEIETENGFGLYGTATGYLGPVTLLFEGKAYGNLRAVRPDVEPIAFRQLAYNNPPTGERVNQILDGGEQTDVYGGRLRGDWVVRPAMVAFANYGLFHDGHGVNGDGYWDPATAETRPGVIHDPYGGLEVRWLTTSRARGAGGWRAVYTEGSGEQVRRDWHADVGVVQELASGWSVEATGLYHERRVVQAGGRIADLTEVLAQIGARWSPRLSVALAWDYSTDPTQPSDDSWRWSRKGFHYFNGTAQWDITSSSSLRVFAGAIHGGERCVAGVCRVVPPFEGVKAALTLRY